MLKYLTAIALSVMLLGGGAAYACPGSTQFHGLKAACGHQPTQLIHLSHLPAQVDLKVGETVAFAADMPMADSTGVKASKPSVALDAPGSLKEMNPDYFNAGTMGSRGDEEALWSAYEATQAGTYTATVTFSTKPGDAPRTMTITFKVAP